MSIVRRKFTVLPDPPDERDYLFKASRPLGTELPSEVDLRHYLSPVVDQGSLGSCTANAIASGFREYLQIQDGQPLTRLSRLAFYWHERGYNGNVNEDSGAYVRDGMKVLADRGCAPEVDWPYIIEKFREKPSDISDAHATAFKIREYHRVSSFIDLQHALAEGSPVVIGTRVFEPFESADTAKTGIVTMPKDGESALGGHAMLACGYKTFPNGITYILVRNSWGTSWGQGGYCWIPKDYFTKTLYVTDMWTGVASIKAEDVTFGDAIKHFVDKGIFDGPEFWANFEAKYKAGTLTNADFEYVFLGFRKIAAKEINSGL